MTTTKSAAELAVFVWTKEDEEHLAYWELDSNGNPVPHARAGSIAWLCHRFRAALKRVGELEAENERLRGELVPPGSVDLSDLEQRLRLGDRDLETENQESKRQLDIISARLRQCGFTGFSDDYPVNAACHAISLVVQRDKQIAELEAANARLREALITYYRWSEDPKTQKMIHPGRILGLLHDVIPDVVEEIARRAEEQA